MTFKDSDQLTIANVNIAENTILCNDLSYVPECVKSLRSQSRVEGKMLIDPEFNEVIQLRRINIYESPILTVKTFGGKVLYIVLDSGAMVSLITLRKATQLNLQIHKTRMKAVCVDGATQLKILGEIHTSVTRNGIDLFLDALVVDKMGQDMDILDSLKRMTFVQLWQNTKLD